MTTRMQRLTGLVAGVGLTPALRETLEQATGPDVAWTIARTPAEMRERFGTGGFDCAPAAVVIRYDRRESWSILTLLGRLEELAGGRATRVLLVSERARWSLPVCLSDESRVELVAPADVAGWLPAMLARPAAE